LQEGAVDHRAMNLW